MYIYIYISLSLYLHCYMIQYDTYSLQFITCFQVYFRCYLSIFLQPPRMVTEEEKELQDTARVRRMYLSQLYMYMIMITMIMIYACIY